MKKLIVLAALLHSLLGAPASAQAVDGQWQGVLQAAPNVRLRIVVKIEKAPKGALSARMYTIDRSLSPLPAETVSLKGKTLTFSIRQTSMSASYEGVLGANGKSIKGTFVQNTSLPLDLVKASAATAWVTDPAPAKVSFVTADDKVKLEVVDWGGSGRPLVFIPGLNATAHVFDQFAVQFTSKYHVYGVTRRGYGASDKPEPTTANYMTDRLGDDVLAVIDELGLEKPVLAGWSMGGGEMSSIAARHPEKISGLVYLDAAYSYAFYAPGNVVPPGGNLSIDINDLGAKIARVRPATASPAETIALIDELLNTSLPQLKADLETRRADLAFRLANAPPGAASSAAPTAALTPDQATAEAITSGVQKYTDLKAVPILAIFATTADTPLVATGPTALQRQAALVEDQIRRFEAGNPTARVVRIANAQHAIFRSHPLEVQNEMMAFIGGLK